MGDSKMIYKIKEPLNKSWASSRGTEAAKYEAQNAGNIGNISKFCNDVVGRLSGSNADHGLNQRFLKHSISLLLVLVCGCTSTTVINTNPNGAQLYLDGMLVGKTPYVHSDSKIVGSTTALKFKMEGYEELNIVMTKSEKANVGAIIAGVFVLVPFLWTMEYYPEHTYELIKVK